MNQELLNTLIPNRVEQEKNPLYLRGVKNLQVEELFETFYPVGERRYITISIDNFYNFWNEVVELIVKPLSDNNIDIVLVSQKNSGENHRFAKVLSGISLRQFKSVINRSSLHVCGVDWTDSLSSSRNVIILDKWESRLSKQEYIDKVENGKNSVENLSSAILGALNIDYKIAIDTIYIGNLYGDNIIEVVPNCKIEEIAAYIDNARFVNVRLDLCDGYDFLLSLESYKIPFYITIDKPLPKFAYKYLKLCQGINIREVRNFSCDELENLQKIGAKLVIDCQCDDEKEAASIKNEYFDWTLKFPLLKKKDYSFLPENGILKTCRYLVSKSGLFLSTAHYSKGLDTQKLGGNEIGKLLNDADFQNELEYFYIYARIRE